jgi:hypothetical protein
MALELTSDRWVDNWRWVSEPGSARVVVGRGRHGAAAALAEVRALPSGIPVVLVADAPGSTRRSRKLAAAAGISVEREYLALPSASAPAYLIEDEPEPFQLFVDRILGSPSHGLLGRVQDVAVAVVRRLRPRRLVSATAAGRIVVGKRV